MKPRPSVQVRQAERGQSLVEMSLMMVILLTILSAVLDLGRGFFSYVAIQNAAGEGALYAAINPRCPHATSVVAGFNCTNPNNVDYRAKNESPPGGLVDSGQMTVLVFYADGTSEYSADTTLEGTPIRVQVQYRFRLIGPFSPVLPNGELIFTANAVQNILDLKQD